MKKLAILSAVALGLTFTACDDNDVISVPVNPEPAIFDVQNLTMTADAQTDATLNLEELNNSAQTISLVDFNVTEFPADYDLNIVMQISKDESFSRIAEVPVSVERNGDTGVVTVNPDDLQGIYYANISKGPKERTIYARYAAYANKDNSSVRLGDPTTYWGPFTLKVLPYPSTLVIEDNYYLLGTINDWSVANAVKFNHSDESPYDDPVFTLKVDISTADAAGGWWWKVVPESTYITGNWVDADNASWGVAENGSEEMSGMLVPRTATTDCGAGCIKQGGSFLITINLEEGTYEFKSAIDNLWTPGNSNGWSHGASQMLYTEDYANYMGFAHLDGEFKFTSKPNWDGINFGSNGTEGQLTNDGGAGNLSAPANGLYWCTANIASLTYNLAPVTALGLIGDACPQGWDNDVALTPSADMLVWEGDIAFGAGEFKIRANHAWEIDFGGEVNDLKYKGGNIAAPAAGNYHVRLDLSTLPYQITLTKK